MNPSTETLGITGPAGRIDIAVDRPREGPVRGIALVAHPHPLYGGTRDNKVVQTLWAMCAGAPTSVALEVPRACTTMVRARPRICWP